MCMRHTSEGRVENLLAACSLAVAERVVNATEDSASLGAGGPAAIVALHTFLGGATIDSLAGVIGLSHAGAVRLVDRLEAAGMLARRPSTRDARAVSLELTRRGRATARRILAARRDAMTDVLSPLPPGRRSELAGLLEQLLAGLTSDHPTGQHICRLCDVDACGHPDRCPVTLAVAH